MVTTLTDDCRKENDRLEKSKTFNPKVMAGRSATVEGRVTKRENGVETDTKQARRVRLVKLWSKVGAVGGARGD